MRPYLLLHDTDVRQDEIVPYLVEQVPGVEEAYAFFESAIYFKTDLDFRRIYEMLKVRYPELQFVLLEADAVRAGSMPGAFWKFLEDRALESAAE